MAAAVDGPYETVVIAPRIAAVLEPLSRAGERIRLHPTLSDIADSTEPMTGLDLLRKGAAVEAGIDVAGPLLVAIGPTGARAAVAVADAQKAGAWLSASAGAAAAEIDGRPGWRWPEGLAVFADGVVYIAEDDVGLARLRRTDARRQPDPLAACPRGRGQADLFVLARSGAGSGCVTARVDAGRVRIDARLEAGSLRPADWLAAGEGLPALGAEPGLAVAAHPGPMLAARLAAGGPPPRALELAVGPGPLDILFSMRPASTTLLDRFVEAARGREDVILGPPGGGLRRIAIKPVDGQQAPPVSEVWLGTAHERAWVGTDRAVIEAGPGVAPKTGLSADLFAGAGLAVYLRPGGVPHDGGPWVDAVAPRLTALGLDVAGMRRFAGGFAWLWAHLGELGLAVRADGARWRIALEAVTL